MKNVFGQPGIRYTLYFISITGLFGIGSLLIHKLGGTIVLQENGIVEWIQILWLVLTCLLIFQGRKLTGLKGEFLFILAFMPIIALVRELDDFSDVLLFHGAWKYIDLVIAAYLVFHGRRKLKELLSELEIFTYTRAFVFMAMGFFIVFAFARIVGQQSLWRVLLEETFHRKIGRLLEEYLELLGYSLILCGAVECWIECRQSAIAAKTESNVMQARAGSKISV